MSKPDAETGRGTDGDSATLEDAMARLMRSERPKDPAAVLDALTFVDPTIKRAMNGAGKFIDHEELMRRLEDHL